MSTDDVYNFLHLIDEENVFKKKSSNYYFFRLVTARGVLTRDYVFEKLKCFVLKKDVCRPFRLVVDIQTQCDFYLKEINIDDIILYNDQIMVFMAFIDMKVTFFY